MRHEGGLHAWLARVRARHGGLALYFACALGIAVLISLYYVVKQRAFAFVDIGIDSFNFYYPIQLSQARQLRDLHDLTWSFDLGLGGYLGLPINPLRLLLAPLPDSWQLGVRLPIYFARVILSGGFFYGYLRRIHFDRNLAVIGGLAFAYSSYAVINGQWDSEGLVVLQFAAYLFFLESYLRGGSAWFAVGAGLVLGAGSIFYPFTFAILSVLYVIARPVFISRDPLAGYAATLARFCGWAALGFLLTAFIQFPNLIYFADSPRVTGGHSVFATLFERAWSLNDGKVLHAEIAGFFGKDLLGVGSHYKGWSNWFEAPGFYAGMLLLVCVPQLFGPSARRRERLFGIVGLVLLAAYILWPAMRYAVYGFGHSGFRLSTLWVTAGLLVLGLAGLRRVVRSGTWRTGLVLAALGIFVAVLAVAFTTPSIVRVQRVAMVLAFTAVYCVLLWPSRVRPASVPMRALLIVFACELLLFSLPAFMQRNAVKSNGSSSVGSYQDGTSKALAFIRAKDRSGEFYRIEKTYQSVYLNDALVQGYSGTKSDYFHGSSITRFVDKMQLPRTHPRTAYISSMVGRPKVLDLLGVRYLLSRNRKLDKDPDMTYVGTAGRIRVYRNDDAHGIAHMYYELAGEGAADKLSRSRRDDLLLQKVVVDDPAAVRGQLATLDGRQPAEAPSSRASLRKISDIRLHVDVSTSRAGVLLVAMPFDPGWSATIDGVRARLFRADYGLTAMLVGPGTHQIDLRYAVRGRTVGKWLSIAALLVLFGVFVTRTVVARRRRDSSG